MQSPVVHVRRQFSQQVKDLSIFLAIVVRGIKSTRSYARVLKNSDHQPCSTERKNDNNAQLEFRVKDIDIEELVGLDSVGNYGQLMSMGVFQYELMTINVLLIVPHRKWYLL